MSYIDTPDSQTEFIYKDVTYIIESSYRGRFLNARTEFDEEITDHEFEGEILQAYTDSTKKSDHEKD